MEEFTEVLQKICKFMETESVWERTLAEGLVFVFGESDLYF